MTLAAAAIVAAGVLAMLPAIGTGTGMPIALGAGIIAVVFTAWSLSTGAIPPLLIAMLLLFAEQAGSIVFGNATTGLVPIGAAGLYLVIELSMRSLEVRGRHPGWRSFGRADAIGITGITLLVGTMAWLISALAGGIDLDGGIFLHGIGIAATAAVLGVIWLLVGRDHPTPE